MRKIFCICFAGCGQIFEGHTEVHCLKELPTFFPARHKVLCAWRWRVVLLWGWLDWVLKTCCLGMPLHVHRKRRGRSFLPMLIEGRYRIDLFTCEYEVIYTDAGICVLLLGHVFWDVFLGACSCTSLVRHVFGLWHYPFFFS